MPAVEEKEKEPIAAPKTEGERLQLHCNELTDEVSVHLLELLITKSLKKDKI